VHAGDLAHLPIIELAPYGSEERSLLESMSNHVTARGVAIEKGQLELPTS